MPLFICAATYENNLEDDEFVTSGFLEYNFHLVPDCFPVDVNNVAAWDELWRIHSHFAVQGLKSPVVGRIRMLGAFLITSFLLIKFNLHFPEHEALEVYFVLLA